MVCGVWSQTDLEEEGASCQVLAWHALSRWIQAWRRAWGERTPVTSHLHNHHHHKTSFLGPSMFELNLPQRLQGKFLPLGRSRMCLSILLFLAWVSFEQLLFIWMLKRVQTSFTPKDYVVAVLYQYHLQVAKRKSNFSYLWTSLTCFTSLTSV